MNRVELENKLPYHLSIFFTEIINEKEGYILVRPKNSQDMSYRLYDTNTQCEFVISSDDIQNNEEDLEEHGGILRQEFLKLSDIDEIKELAWKVYDSDRNVINNPNI